MEPKRRKTLRRVSKQPDSKFGAALQKSLTSPAKERTDAGIPKSPKGKRKLPVTLPGGTLLRLGHAAADNAIAIWEDAQLLAEHGRWARATALMITATEEAGKAYYATLLAIGATPMKEDSIRLLFNHHAMKQALARFPSTIHGTKFAETLYSLVREASSTLESRGSSEFAESTEKFFDMVERVVDLQPDLKSFVGTLILEGTTEFNKTAREKREEELRQRALYVDVDARTLAIGIPNRVTERDYRDQFEALERNLWVIQFVKDTNSTPGEFDQMREMLPLMRKRAAELKATASSRAATDAPIALGDDAPEAKIDL